jgi:hypothetical protein
MPHAVNRNAFLAAKGCGHLLLSAYGLLVAAELALKDHYRVWNKKHDIPQMLDDLADPGLTALGAALRTSLGAIPCTHVDGNQASIPGNNYPHLRYTRHASDFASGTTDEHLQELVQTVDDIIVRLRTKGVAV